MQTGAQGLRQRLRRMLRLGWQPGWQSGWGGPARQAWGMAPQQGAWVLVGLNRQGQDRVQVHTALSLQPPTGTAHGEWAWLSQALRQSGRAQGGASRHRLNLALAAEHLQEGHLDFSLDLAQEEWVHEVQMEVSQALGLEPDEISFDFAPASVPDGRVQRVHWMGCEQTHLSQFKSCARAAGWHLAAVESEQQAALRGASLLQGGVGSLLTQAPSDWQFRLPVPVAAASKERHRESDDEIERAVSHLLTTSAGPRLVASGLALRAWP